MREARTTCNAPRLLTHTRVGSGPLARLCLVASALLLAAGCAQPPPPEPTPDIDAIVQAAIAKAMPAEAPSTAPDVRATVQAGVQATMEALALTPTVTPTPTPIPTPTPTRTSTPTRTPIPTPTPTNTPPPTPTFTPVPTPIPTHTPAPTPTSTPTSTPSPAPVRGTVQSIADIVERTRAGVVRIAGTSGAGSGFVVDPAGYILTNEHVLGRPGRLSVVFDHGARLTPQVVASDAARDIALLKVASTRQLTALPLATEAREGEEVVALGYPLDLEGGMSVTRGIVSAFRTYGGVEYVQTDAATNPGSSGGPLLNLRGEVVGMSSRGLLDAQGIGFAIRYDILSSRLALMMSDASSGGTASTRSPTSRAAPPSSFGPVNGSLDHNPSDGFIPTFVSGLDVTDFVAEVTFATPHDMTGGTWSSGFLFRHTGQRTGHVVVIHRSGRWSHYLRTDGPGDYRLDQVGLSASIRTGQNAKNHVRVIASGNAGWLLVNGSYVAELDLSGLVESGSVTLVGAFFRSDEVQGLSTPYSDFTVRTLRRVYGPRDGSIDHDPNDGRIDTDRTSTSLADGVIEARFFNPYSTLEGDWSSGFLFRSSVPNGFHVVGIEESGRWFHRLRTGAVDSTQRLADDLSTQISTGPFGSNHIRIIALGGEGWLFINGAYVDKLDLSGRLDAGSVSAVGSYFAGDGIAGKSTRFEELTIWSAASAP